MGGKEKKGRGRRITSHSLGVHNIRGIPGGRVGKWQGAASLSRHEVTQTAREVCRREGRPSMIDGVLTECRRGISAPSAG